MTNKPAQVTEAHRELVLKIRRSAFDGSFAIRQSRCDELIADSEARALSELAIVAADSADRNVSLRLKNNQLRDEAERLTTNCTQLQESCRYHEARAERAEAELAKERARLDFMNTRGFEHRHHETGDWLAYEWTITSAAEHKDVNLRDTIDAAMKEESK